MPGRFVRSKIAELVTETIGRQAAREELSAHGWSDGMPIVIARHDEKLRDVMALVAIHQPPVMIASVDPLSGDLCFTYVAIGCAALEVVDPHSGNETIIDFYREACSTSCLTFRIEQLASSAIAHGAPPIKVQTQARYGIPQPAMGVTKA